MHLVAASIHTQLPPGLNLMNKVTMPYQCWQTATAVLFLNNVLSKCAIWRDKKDGTRKYWKLIFRKWYIDAHD